MKKSKILAVLGSLVLTQLIGCAGFRANNLPAVEAENLKASTDSKTRVYSEWKIESPNASVSNADAMLKAGENFKQRFEKALLGADCCIAANSESEADVIIKAVSHDENSRAAFIPAFITGFSLYTIPSWATFHVHFTATASNQGKDAADHKYDISDSLTMVQWLPMLFAFPFANPFTEGEEMEVNAFNNLILAMQKDGVLPSAQKVPEGF